MSGQLKTEDVLMQIRSKLQVDDVKLWLEPYYFNGIGSSEDELKALARNYSGELSIPEASCLCAIVELQEYALEKLKERDHFKNTGIATLKIRIPKEGSGTKITSLEIRLEVTGLELKNEIASRTEQAPTRFKMISGGRVLIDDKTLLSQGVKNGAQIMVVLLHDNLEEILESNKLRNELDSIKADTNLLASKQSDYFMNLEDQFGNSVKLPAKERKAIFIAMALHEKGRDALKKGDFSTAIVMFLDSDKQFSECNSSILDTVDNYALLNLDIVWCYLCLQSISQIPEAEERLRKCERSFIKTYGKNLERVIAVKGTPGNEAALFMRLHLLQAIVKYHQNKRNEAYRLLLKAEDELKQLKIDENSQIALMELGYTTTEARIGLRATQNNVNAAAEYVNTNREKRKESRKKTLQEWLKNREKYKLGKCADGKQYVEPKFIEMMVNMGYSKETAKRALQQGNNNVSMSVQIIQDNPELLDVEESGSNHSLSNMSQIIEEMVPQLEQAGFNIEAVKHVLKQKGGDIVKTLDAILNPEGPSTSTDGSGPSNNTIREIRAKQKELEAYERLNSIISTADDDHLDLSLEQEELFLYQYLSLLKPESI